MTADALTSSFQLEIESRQHGNASLDLEREGAGLKEIDLGFSHREVNAGAVRMDEITEELTCGGRVEDKPGGAEGRKRRRSTLEADQSA